VRTDPPIGPTSNDSKRSVWSSRQVASRAANGTKMRISAARLPAFKTLEDFTFEHMPTAPRDVIAHLATTTFVARKENVVLLGPPAGTGKTHLAIALAIKAAEAAYPIAFDSATGWITRLADAHAHGRLTQELHRLNRFRVILIDEVGYLPFDAASASFAPTARRRLPQPGQLRLRMLLVGGGLTHPHLK